jgi:hypothetical protein
MATHLLASIAWKTVLVTRDILVPLLIAFGVVAIARWWGLDIGPSLAE